MFPGGTHIMDKDEPNSLENMMDTNNRLLQSRKLLYLSVIKMHSCKRRQSISDI